MGSNAGDDLEECTACGACCFDDDDRYVELWSVDQERLGASLHRVAVARDGRLFLRMLEGRCASLRVTQTSSAEVTGARSFTCAIYDRRPDACRALARGSRACIEARRARARQRG
jgi:Fe-S-cluster containining protein